MARVFIVDDSAVSRVALRRILSREAGFELVGEAEDGKRALQRVPRAAPDLVLMDVVMPVLDGIAATRELVRAGRWRVVLISDLVQRDAHLNFRALEAGALEVLKKPSRAELERPELLRAFHRKIRLLAEVPVVTRFSRAAADEARRTGPPRLAEVGARRVELVCVGASTGGPIALQRLLGAAARERRPPWPIAIVQHMSPGFTAGMVRWLEEVTRMPVREASHRRTLEAGVAYVAPEGRHLTVTPGGVAVLSESPPLRGHRPAVDRLFESIADSELARGTLAVLLTGMGDDGARGLARLREAGAWTVAQDAGSCVVDGMPRAARDRDAACEVLPLEGIGPRLLELTAPPPRRPSRAPPRRLA